MKKTLLSILFALALCLTLLPMAAFADEAGGAACPHSAVNNETGACSDCGYQMAIKRTLGGETAWFDTVAAALDGIRNSASYTIVNLTLYQDVNAGTASANGLNLTLDLNGRTLTADVPVSDGGL